MYSPLYEDVHLITSYQFAGKQVNDKLDEKIKKTGALIGEKQERKKLSIGRTPYGYMS